MQQINEWLHTLGYILLGLLIFVGGFYFGGKSTENRLAKDYESRYEISTFAQEINSTGAELQTTTESLALEIPGVHWIRVGEAPICPESHPLKGKFDKNVNIYYLPDYPQYDKVKAQICLSDEQFATQSAGFIRKY